MFRICFFILCFLMSTPAMAAEVIHSYDVRVEILQNGSLNIKETIEVTAEGKEIRRGIYRDFPLYRRTFLGGKLPSYYNIRSIKRDGKVEAYHTETSEENNYYRVYIGESNYFLPTGRRYIYEIDYTIPGQVFFFDEYDELNWNVIGTNWNFPIQRATAQIVLPYGANVESFSVYTGKALSRGDNYEAIIDGNILKVNTKEALAPKQGVTVAVSFPKGYVYERPDMVGYAFFWKQHPGLKIMLLGFFLLSAYYYWAWRCVGVDPKSRGLAPFYTPPKGISPAMAAVIHTMGSADKQKTMSSAIISLASKGYFTIEEKGKRKYVISRTPDELGRPKISEDEQIIYDKITTGLTITRSSEALIETAKEHKKKLDDLCQKKYFFVNLWWWFAGLAGYALILFKLSTHPDVPGFFWGGLAFVAMFGGISMGVMIHSVKTFFKGTVSEKAGAIFMMVWATGFSVGGFMGFFLLSTMLSWLVIAMIVIIGALVVAMQPIMKAPTYVGRRTMDHIDGLKYYMEAVEEKVLQKFDPPQMSRELYEKYLPYAVALDVESKWADKFETAIGVQEQVKSKNFHRPHWYSGASSSVFSPSSMVSNFGSTLAAASSSNSSSSGGGSSGGGGGGGGGGGW